MNKILKDKPPIYIIPGSLDLLMLYTKWVRFFKSKNYAVFVAPVGLGTSRVEINAEKVKNDIINRNLNNIIIISASLGSVIAKYTIDNFEEINKRVKKIVAVCSPFKGTKLAIIAPFIPSYKQIVPSCRFINKLNISKSNNSKIISIRPFFDTEVYSIESERVEGAKNIQAKVIGHIFAPYKSEVIRLILKEVNNS